MNGKALNIHYKPTRKVGFVLKPHGFNGRIRIGFEDDAYEIGDFLLLSINNKFVPFIIEEFNEKGSLVKLQGINTLEQAEELTGLAILDLDEGETQETDELLGYTITDKNSGS